MDEPILLLLAAGMLLAAFVYASVGHGGASGRYDRLKETAFDYAFLLTQLGLVKPEVPAPRS